MANLYADNIQKRIEPDLWENGAYKQAVDKIDWKKISNSDISKARMGYKVIGSDPANQWKINYSQYKDLLIKAQGSSVGYNENELLAIRSATKGYSSKK